MQDYIIILPKYSLTYEHKQCTLFCFNREAVIRWSEKTTSYLYQGDEEWHVPEKHLQAADTDTDNYWHCRPIKKNCSWTHFTSQVNKIFTHYLFSQCNHHFILVFTSVFSSLHHHFSLAATLISWLNWWPTVTCIQSHRYSQPIKAIKIKLIFMVW